MTPVDLAHARLAVAVVTAAREGFDGFLDRYLELVADIADDDGHPLNGELSPALVEWWLANMALSFADLAAEIHDGEDVVGEMIRGWAVGLELVDAGDS